MKSFDKLLNSQVNYAQVTKSKIVVILFLHPIIMLLFIIPFSIRFIYLLY